MNTPAKMKTPKSLTLMYFPLALVVSFSLYFSIKWGLKPKPIPQINPTQFDIPEQIGAVTYRRLRPALRQEKLVILGSSPWNKDASRVWNGFIAAAKEDKWNVNHLYEDPSLNPIKPFDGLERVPMTWPVHSPTMIQEIRQKLEFGQLIIVHTTYNHSSHRGEGSLAAELENQLKRPWTSITMLGFGVNLEEMLALQPQCPSEVAPQNRSEYVACAAYRISRNYFRKKLDPSKTWAAMDRHGLKDYFLYIREGQSQTSVDH